MPSRRHLQKAGPETGTIFGHQIQSTKSEAPLWGLTFCGSYLVTENGLEKWAWMTNSCGIPLPAIPWKLTVSVFHITITEYISATQQLSSHARHDCPIVGILWRFDPCGNRMEKTIKRQCWTWRSRGCGEETRAAGEGGNGSRRRSDG